MEKFYFTYGTDSGYPFRGGWTLIEAPDLKIAIDIFRAFHPDRDVRGILNFANYYRGENFEQMQMYKTGNFGEYCHETIRVTRELTKSKEGTDQ